MARLNARDYLQPDEEVVREDRRHPLSVLDDVLLVLALLIALAFGLTYLVQANPRAPRSLVPLLWAAAGTAFIAYLVPRVLRVITSRYLLTDQRIYESHGRLRFQLSQTTYDKITDLHVYQGFFGRMLGFGTVRAQTAGAAIALAGARDPFALKTDLEGARVRFIEKLVAEHKKTRKTVAKAGQELPAEAPVAAAQTVWAGSPHIISFVSNAIGAFVFLVFAIVFGGLWTAGETGPLRFVPWLMVAFGLLMLGRIWVQYRFTKYEVTGRGLVVTSGWLGRVRVETTFEKVTDVTTHQSLIGRLFGFGDILANTAGGLTAPIRFQGASRPLEVKEIIERARAQRTGGARP